MLDGVPGLALAYARIAKGTILLSAAAEYAHCAMAGSIYAIADAIASIAAAGSVRAPYSGSCTEINVTPTSTLRC